MIDKCQIRSASDDLLRKRRKTGSVPSQRAVAIKIRFEPKAVIIQR